MSKSQIESLKAIASSTIIPNQDMFKENLDKIEKILNSINLVDTRNRSSKKAIDAIMVALKNLVMLNPNNAVPNQPQISRMLIKLLSPTVEGEIRQFVWANTVDIISFCNALIPFQQLDGVVETAFFFKQLHSVSDQKTASLMEECIRDQCAQICNNSNIFLDHQRFEYWVNIIFQFILPIFWQNMKFIDVKKLRESVIDHFLSFLNHNLVISGSSSTLSKKFNPFVNYYTMQLLFSSLEMMNSDNEINDHFNLVLNFIRLTFPCKIQQVYKFSKEQPIELSAEKTIDFYIQQKVPSKQISSFFVATLTPKSSSLIQELSESPNLCPQIFEIISKLNYRITEIINYSTSQKSDKIDKRSTMIIHILEMEGLLKGFIQIVPQNKLNDSLFKYIFEYQPPTTTKSTFYQHLFQMLCILFEYGEKGIELQALVDLNRKLEELAKRCEPISKNVYSVIHVFSKILASVFCQNILNLRYAPQNNELLFINPVFYTVRKNNISYCYSLYMNASRWQLDKVQQFTLDFISTFGSSFQYAGMISFVSSLFNLSKELKGLRPNFDFFDKKLIPLMMGYFKNAQTTDLLRLLNDVVSQRLSRKSIDHQMAINWTCLLLKTIKSKTEKTSQSAIFCAMSFYTFSQFILSLAFIEAINNKFSFDLYEAFPSVVLQYLSSTTYTSTFFDCPSSTQLFYSLTQNPKFVLTEQFIQTFFLIFLEEVAIDDKDFTTESKKLLKYIFEKLTHDEENKIDIKAKKYLLAFISSLPLYAPKIQKKDPHLFLEIIPELQSYTISSQDAETAHCLMKLMGDLLVVINSNEPLFHPCFKFMLNSYNQRDDFIRNESFNFFLSHYSHNFEKALIPKSADCIILDSSENMLIVDFKSQMVLVSNKYNSDQYHVDFVPISQASVNKNDSTIGYFLPHSPLSLFFDAILSSKKDKQYLVTSQQNIHLGFNLINRSVKECYLVSILYISQTCKTIEDCVSTKIEDTSPLFEQFLTSIGQIVNVNQTEFRYNEIMQKEETALYFENIKYQIMYMVGPLMKSPKFEYFNKTDITIIWFDGMSVNFPESKFSSKIVIKIRPLSKGLVHVVIKSKLEDTFLFLPLSPIARLFIIPQCYLGFIIQITIMLAESQMNGSKHSIDSDSFKSMLKLCSSQNPLFK